jgi:hypothetical protein
MCIKPEYVPRSGRSRLGVGASWVFDRLSSLGSFFVSMLVHMFRASMLMQVDGCRSRGWTVDKRNGASSLEGAEIGTWSVSFLERGGQVSSEDGQALGLSFL